LASAGEKPGSCYTNAVCGDGGDSYRDNFAYGDGYINGRSAHHNANGDSHGYCYSLGHSNAYTCATHSNGDGDGDSNGRAHRQPHLPQPFAPQTDV
jgi:hypothetical protein